jgi:polyprenyldihydroxybenzoate methyltransferase / 3-demethylubiquinol 3-O-methyltransferase
VSFEIDALQCEQCVIVGYLRVPFILDGLAEEGMVKSQKSFEDLKVLDVGCGAGILTEAIALLQANVVGLDASIDLITVAQTNRERFSEPIKARVTYVCETIEEHANKFPGHYDVVVASEVLEHVIDKKSFLDSCAKALKPGGSIFVTTFNKTVISFFLTKVFAEYILGLGPIGTHTWSMFMGPKRVEAILERSQCQKRRLKGMSYNVLQAKWSLCWCKWSSYALHMVKGENIESTRL